jgi:DNA-binding transcriptional regulator/RsmH inhibitor MraZ
MKPPPELVAEHIEAIRKSPAFARAPRSRSLLRYLAERTARNIPTSEKDIAVEVFKRAATFDPSKDAIVRVAISQVKELLTAFYQTSEGQEDRIRIDIPKHAYAISAEFVFSGEETAQLLQQTKRTLGETLIPRRERSAPEGIYKALLDEQGFLHLPRLFLKWLSPPRKNRVFVTTLDRTVASIYPMPDWQRHVEYFRQRDSDVALNIYVNSQHFGRESTITTNGLVFIHDELRQELELDFEVVRIASDFRSVVFCKEAVYQERMHLP